MQPLWGNSGLSKSTISRANQALKDAFATWRGRGLSGEDIVYLFLDGFYLGVRQSSREKEAVLVAHGINREGKRVVLHLSLGVGRAPIPGRVSCMTWWIGDSNPLSSSSRMATLGFCELFVTYGQR